jgi:circadian clock protein KaiB
MGELDPEPGAEYQAVSDAPGTMQFVLRLYIAGNAPQSMRALSNVRRLCHEQLNGRCDLEVIDIYQQPELALEAKLIAVPTLIRYSPPPLRRITGDLSSLQQLLSGLEPRKRAEGKAGR